MLNITENAGPKQLNFSRKFLNVLGWIWAFFLTSSTSLETLAKPLVYTKEVKYVESLMCVIDKYLRQVYGYFLRCVSDELFSFLLRYLSISDAVLQLLLDINILVSRKLVEFQRLLLLSFFYNFTIIFWWQLFTLLLY